VRTHIFVTAHLWVSYMNSDNVKMVTTVASFLTREVAKENGVYPFVLLRRGWSPGIPHGAKEATLLYMV